MKIYSIKTSRTAPALLTASELMALHAIECYRHEGIEPIIDQYEVKTQGKNFNSYALAKQYQKPF